MQSRLNLAIKERESFRPFAPVVLEDRVDEWFEFDRPSRYMSFVAQVRGSTSFLDPGEGAGSSPAEPMDLTALLSAIRSPIPAVTHVDGSARLQTVDRDLQPELHRILTSFEARTGCPVLVNTSFNVRGEPIVCTADDAYRCFMTTGMDWLVVDDCLLAKDEQPPWTGPAALRLPD